MNDISFEYCYTIGGYCTFIVKVISGMFSGASSFCISESSLKDAISSLNKMYDSDAGVYRMNDYDSDDFISVEFQKLGHLCFAGQVGGSHRQQCLKYQFVADRSVLSSLISGLQSMIK